MKRKRGKMVCNENQSNWDILGRKKKFHFGATEMQNAKKKKSTRTRSRNRFKMRDRKKFILNNNNNTTSPEREEN